MEFSPYGVCLAARIFIYLGRLIIYRDLPLRLQEIKPTVNTSANMSDEQVLSLIPRFTTLAVFTQVEWG